MKVIVEDNHSVKVCCIYYQLFKYEPDESMHACGIEAVHKNGAAHSFSLPELMEVLYMYMCMSSHSV